MPRVFGFVDTEQLQSGRLMEARGGAHVGDEEGAFEIPYRHGHPLSWVMLQRWGSRGT